MQAEGHLPPVTLLCRDEGTLATLDVMRRTEAGSAMSFTRADHVALFSSFLAANTDDIEFALRDFLPFARNYAAGGPVVERAAAMLNRAVRHVWIARDPRPPAPPRYAARIRSFPGAKKVAFTAGGTQLVMARDTALEVRDVTTGAPVMTLGAHDNRDPTIGHTDSITGFALEESVGVAVSVANDQTLRLWDLASGTCRRTMSVPGGRPDDVVLSRDARLAVTLHRYEVHAWDLKSGASWPLPAKEGRIGMRDNPTSVAMATAKNGQQLALVSRHGPADSDPTRSSVTLFDVSSATQLTVLHDGYVVASVSLSADGGLAATADGHEKTVRLWDASSSRCLQILRGHTDSVYAAVLSPDGRIVVSGGLDGVLRVWSTDTGECVRAVPAHASGVYRLAITRSGALAATLGHPRTGATRRTVVWDLARGVVMPDPEWHTCPVTSVAVSPDGRRAVSASAPIVLKGQERPLLDHDPIRVWDTATGACIDRPPHDPREPMDVSFVGTAVRLVPNQRVSDYFGVPVSTGGPEGVLRVQTADGTLSIETPAGRSWRDPTLTVGCTATGERLATYCAGSEVTALSAILPDGRFACGTRDGEVHFLRLAYR